MDAGIQCEEWKQKWATHAACCIDLFGQDKPCSKCAKIGLHGGIHLEHASYCYSYCDPVEVPSEVALCFVGAVRCHGVVRLATLLVVFK